MTRKLLFIIMVSVGISLVIPSIFVHEGVHWVIDSYNPWVYPDRAVFFTEEAYAIGATAFVECHERYPHSAADRPWWFEPLNESLAYTTQIAFAVAIAMVSCSKSLDYLHKKRTPVF